ncbi:zinc finger, FYVE domain containing 9 (predicted), isoform CRA_b [Rattus norvegicus]|uniref:Zinc finger, FYVE domain containing 9 (Predicted), isoform CRA_b n=1 Tax=Rattus norvegicus TaxID=10116 RepID=A6JYV9_RAT|nr:zinc finger, FYVE domain containing 9 (predicted), isoform CRA_b [Rattus norvegicus]
MEEPASSARARSASSSSFTSWRTSRRWHSVCSVQTCSSSHIQTICTLKLED